MRALRKRSPPFVLGAMALVVLYVPASAGENLFKNPGFVSRPDLGHGRLILTLLDRDLRRDRDTSVPRT